jgi:hypothetical protein
MPIKNGMYKVFFKTALGEGAGVIITENGTIRGGDSAFYYLGTYHQHAGHIEAQVTGKRHSPGLPSVFGPNQASITLTGQSQGDEAHYDFKGSSPEAPGVIISALLTKLAD